MRLDCLSLGILTAALRFDGRKSYLRKRAFKKPYIGSSVLIYQDVLSNENHMRIVEFRWKGDAQSALVEERNIGALPV